MGNYSARLQNLLSREHPHNRTLLLLIMIASVQIVELPQGSGSGNLDQRSDNIILRAHDGDSGVRVRDSGSSSQIGARGRKLGTSGHAFTDEHPWRSL